MSDVSLNLIFPNLAEDEDDVEEDAEAAVTEEEDEEEEEETFSDTLTATVSVSALAATMNRCLAAATAPEVTGVKEKVEEVVEDGAESDMEGVEGLEAEVEVGMEGLEARLDGREGGVLTLSAETLRNCEPTPSPSSLPRRLCLGCDLASVSRSLDTMMVVVARLRGGTEAGGAATRGGLAGGTTTSS